MDGLEPSALQVVAGFVLLAALFVVREIASGALKKAGEDLWEVIRRRTDSELPDESKCPCRDKRD